LNRKLISMLLGTLLCLTALPQTANPNATASRPAATAVRTGSTFASAVLSGLSRDVFNLALGAVQCAVRSGDIEAPATLTVIDYSRPSTEPRLWVFDLHDHTLLFKELVAHGRNTGENMAAHFSDAMNSKESSLGLFVADNTYMGSNGYSLRLDGLEPGFNGNARDRAIVMHGAPYVNETVAASQGRLGRSWGCPALREAVAHQVIDTIRGGGIIFSYYPDSNWLKKSRYLSCTDSGTQA
jgi:hypothetical protein